MHGWNLNSAKQHTDWFKSKSTMCLSWFIWNHLRTIDTSQCWRENCKINWFHWIISIFICQLAVLPWKKREYFYFYFARREMSRLSYALTVHCSSIIWMTSPHHLTFIHLTVCGKTLNSKKNSIEMKFSGNLNLHFVYR